jgi:uncharacterized protein YkwD
MFNFVDLFILLLIIYLGWQGYQTGLIGGLLNMLITIASFVLATTFYSSLGQLISQKFGFGENISLVIGFLLILVGLEVVFSLASSFFYRKVAKLYKKSSLVSRIDKYLGVAPSLLVGLFLTTVLMLLILTLPVKPWLRDPIAQSWWGSNVVSRAFSFVPTIEKTLNKLPYRNLVYILTPVNPNSEDSQKLNISPNAKFKEDPVSEKEMFDLVNQERAKQGLKQLKWSDPLRDVGRSHCLDMFERSYFSHYTPEGLSPFDRIDKARIQYFAAGENLAYAPSVVIAHQGLMDSPGHRANILRPEFGTLGVGVIDGGFNGKMFCQEFSD